LRHLPSLGLVQRRTTTCARSIQQTVQALGVVAAWPCLRATGRDSKPWAAIAPAISLTKPVACGSLPRRCFVAISQAEAALTRTEWSSFPIAARAGIERVSSPPSHQIRACVSSKSLKSATPPNRRRLPTAPGLRPAAAQKTPAQG
jgi:hypothetical protein